MKVYLAAPYGARETVRGYAEQLRAEGFECTSSWLLEQHEINSGTQGPAAALTDEQVSAHAVQDLEDVDGSDLLVLFTAASVGVDGGGGRHVETGYALAQVKPIIVVGPPENVFHRIGMPEVQGVVNWPRALESIQRRYAGECVVCGCGEYTACVGGCWWAYANLCSRCVA